MFGCFLATVCQTDSGQAGKLFADPIKCIGQLWTDCFPDSTDKVNPVNIYKSVFIFFIIYKFLTDHFQNNIWRILWQVLPAYIDTHKSLPDKQQEIAKLQYLLKQKHTYSKQKHHMRNLKKEFVSVVCYIY
jgi:hypothetical protein